MNNLIEQYKPVTLPSWIDDKKLVEINLNRLLRQEPEPLLPEGLALSKDEKIIIETLANSVVDLALEETKPSKEKKL